MEISQNLSHVPKRVGITSRGGKKKVLHRAISEGNGGYCSDIALPEKAVWEVSEGNGG